MFMHVQKLFRTTVTSTIILSVVIPVQCTSHEPIGRWIEPFLLYNIFFFFFFFFCFSILIRRCSTPNVYSRVAQRKRAGPITQRSMDRNHPLLQKNPLFSSFFLLFFNFDPPMFHAKCVQQSGAAEACWAHNPEVDGSKPSSATSFSSFFFVFSFFNPHKKCLPHCTAVTVHLFKKK